MCLPLLETLLYQYYGTILVLYQYCNLHHHHQTAEVGDSGEVVFETKSWCPPHLSLQVLGEQLQQEVRSRRKQE